METGDLSPGFPDSGAPRSDAGCPRLLFFSPSLHRRVPLDKSEGVVKGKKSLAMRQHRDPRQRS